jgi:hypothetical protein
MWQLSMDPPERSSFADRICWMKAQLLDRRAARNMIDACDGLRAWLAFWWHCRVLLAVPWQKSEVVRH